MSKKVIWVTWEEQRRNQGVADALGANFHEFDLSKMPRWKKYIVGSLKTLKLFRTERPDVVIVQNPSVVLAFLAVICQWIFRFKAGVDSHNAAFAIDTNSRILRRLSLFIQRNANFIIAHNDELKLKVQGRGGTVFALPDRVPEIPLPTNEVEVRSELFTAANKLFYICTFAKDEPYMEVIESAKRNAGVAYFISGNYKKVGLTRHDVPGNVFLLGRVSWDEFDVYLHHCDAVMDLTKRDDCLLCGNYEAVAVGKPLITSSTEALRNYFSKGTIYTDNTARNIAMCVDVMFGHTNLMSDLKRDMIEFKDQLSRDWFRRLEAIQEFINRKRAQR